MRRREALRSIHATLDTHVLAIQRKQVLRIRSSDNTAHNVHIFGGANKEENISMSQPMEVERTYKSPKIGMRIKCDIHPWMGC